MLKWSRVKDVAIWVVTLLLAFMSFRSGVMKMPGVPGSQFWMRDFQRWGYPGWFRLAVGIAEIVSAVFVVVPQLASYGAGIFAVVMVGAIFTHATHAEWSRLPLNLILLALSLALCFARRSILLKK